MDLGLALCADVSQRGSVEPMLKDALAFLGRLLSSSAKARVLSRSSSAREVS